MPGRASGENVEHRLGGEALDGRASRMLDRERHAATREHVLDARPFGGKERGPCGIVRHDQDRPAFEAERVLHGRGLGGMARI